MYLVIALIIGIACGFIGSSKGRNPVGWFLIGFFLGLIGLIICLCMSNLNEERQYRSQQNEENRRLREKLRQEQLKLESLRRHTAERLDLHDRALQMDTRTTTPQMLGGGTGYAHSTPYEQAPPSISIPLEMDPEEPGGQEARIWHYIQDQRKCGPVTSRQLSKLIFDGEIDRDTLVWRESLPEWVEAARVPELNSLFI